MKIKIKKKPRIFFPREDQKIKIKDLGDIELMPDEQLTFVKESEQGLILFQRNGVSMLHHQ